MSAMRIIPCGDDALRLVPADPYTRSQIARALHATGIWREVVIGRTGVTVQFDPVSMAQEDAVSLLNTVSVSLAEDSAGTAEPLMLPMKFGGKDGPDLQLCAEANSCSTERFIHRIMTSELAVDMIGFAPGFAYVAGVDPGLHGGRLSNPRVKVAAGSVGFIHGFLGIYALDGPGGWPIIGRTDVKLFDATAAEPAILTAGRKLLIQQA